MSDGTAPEADGGVPSEVAADWPLWGGTARLVVRPGDDDPVLGQAVLGAARGLVDEVVAQVDAACSRFRPDSEVVRLAEAGGGSYEVSELLAAAVSVALRAARLTDGAVDPTLGNALVSAGYDADIATVRGRDAAQRAGPERRTLPPVRAASSPATSRPPHGWYGGRAGGTSSWTRSTTCSRCPRGCCWTWVRPRRRSPPTGPQRGCTTRSACRCW